MKRKLLLAALCVVGALGFKAQAQVYIETDLTSQFSALTVNTNWKTGAGGTAGYTATTFCPTVAVNGLGNKQVCEFYESNCNRTGDILYQTVTGLTAGTYKIELYGAAAYTFGRGFASTAFSEGTWNAGDKIDPTEEVSTGVTLYAQSEGVTYGGEIPIYYATDFPDGAAVVTLSGIEVGQSGSIKIGMSKTSTSTNWHVVQLKGVTAQVNAVDALSAAVASAQAVSAENVPASIYSELSSVVETYNKSYETAQEYIDAISAINTAVVKANAYADAKPKMDNIAAILSSTNFYTAEAYADYTSLKAQYDAGTMTVNEVNSIDAGSRVTGLVPNILLSAWTIGGNNALPDDRGLYINTWSTEGNGDGSQFFTPFFEYWTGDANSLAATNLTGTLTGLPEGTYRLSAWVRVRAKNGQTAPSGITAQVNDGKVVNISAGEQIGTSQLFINNYNIIGNVDESGVLSFKIVVEEGNNISWLAFQNVQYEQIESIILPEEITLTPSTTSLTTGQILTYTATISPENADEKGVTWASSDESVATVVNGVVTALKPGTVTITVTADADENVNASVTITVTDAAAPAFFASEIAAEDYYIVNAATGKFLGGANSWGTQASLIKHGIPFTAALNNGTYTLDSHTYNSATDHFLTGTYVDGASTPLYIKSVGDGKFSISTADGSAFLTATAGSTVVANTAGDASNTLAQWYFISKADRDKMLAAATAENPVDATYYIKQANISRNLSAGAQNENAWSNLSTGGTQENSNFVAQVYDAAVDVVQTIEGIPNGTYTLTMQGFTSGTDVKLYANDVEVDVRANDSGATSCAAASVFFAAKSYPNTLSVTVTDHTLRIGLKGDCSNSKWLCYDNFELYMTNYIPVTAITATIEPEGDIEIGNTAQITFATTPSPASFDALTITSSNEAVATVSEAGLVTAIAEGEATITIAAEMENITKTFDITVVKPAVLPTSVVLDETEIALNETTTTATLTATVGEEGAPQAVVWTSSDENVATVSAEGEVTAVLPGSATIRATALNYDEVYAEASVTVTFPETVVPETNFTNDGATRHINTLGENLIKNGVFEYPDAFYGWTQANDYSTKITSSNFTIKTDGEGNKYLVGTVNGATGGNASLGTAWAIEAGKTYQFSYDVKKEGTGSDYQYLKTSLTNSPKTESKVLGYPSTMSNDWTTVSYTFTNSEESVGAEYQYLQIHFRWLNSQWGFRNFYLCEVNSTTTEGNVDYATAAIPTANIGTGAFQYSQDAIDAANALVQGTATVDDVEAAYAAVTTLNAPESTQAYNLVFNCEGHNYTGNALTLIPNPAQTQGLYGLKYLAPANVNLAQAFYFVHTTGNKYKIYAVDTDGEDRYITTQAEGYNTQWYEGIRTITDASKAMEVEIRPNGEGLYLLWNTGANKAIAHNGNSNNDMFTNNTANFQFVETSKPSITINTTAAGWGTTILPFAVAELPEGVKAYTCAATQADGTTLELEEVNALETNKPYIIEGSWEETLTGDAQGTDLTYTQGWLTGVYAATAAPVGSYVLQNNDKVGFYQVAEGKQPTVGANRAYLTVPEEAKSRAAFFFEADDATAISTIAAMTAGEVDAIYTVGGAKVESLQKGVNILKMKNGQTRKVIVK